MDTRIATPLFDLVLPGAWTRSTPEPGLTVFRSPAGTEQLSISRMKVQEPFPDADQDEKLRAFVQLRRESEWRLAPHSRLSDVTYFEDPRRATYTAEEAPGGRRAATFVLVRETGFVILYLESIGGTAVSFDDLTTRLSSACATSPAAGHSQNPRNP